MLRKVARYRRSALRMFAEDSLPIRRLSRRWEYQTNGATMHTPPADEIMAYIRASKDVLDLFKSLAGLMPKGAHAEQTQQRVAEAERALKAAEAQLAKTLGYNLCQCTFPPQIMLSKGRHPTQDREVFKCGECGKQEPSEAHLNQLDEADRQFKQGPTGGSWMV
jgi:hypothetical protein